MEFERHGRRAARLVTGLALAAGSLVLAGCSAGHPAVGAAASTVACPHLHAGLTPATGPTTTLPPSHDNDVGGRRLPDLHPDADVDAPLQASGHRAPAPGPTVERCPPS